MNPTPYVMTISAADYRTLTWLADRGYDGRMVELAHEDWTEDAVTFSWTEPAIWEVAEYVEEDPDAFLACNGSPTLAAAVLAVLESVV